MMGLSTVHHKTRRAAIANAIEQWLAGRLGQNQHTMKAEGGENFPHPPNAKSRDIAAERAAIAKALEKRLKKKAEARMLAGVRQDPKEKFPEGVESRDVVAEKAGFGSGRTYEAAEKRGPAVSIDALITGRLHTAPERRTSASWPAMNPCCAA